MDEIITEIEINAPPQAVWDVLTDFEGYDEWNPVMEISGNPTEGDRLTMVLTLPDRKPQPFKPKVLVADEPAEFRWQGRLFVPGLYDGEHWFDLTPLEEGRRTRLTHAETFRGVLVGFINRRIGTEVETAFEEMNAALKARVEGDTAEQGGESSVELEPDSEH
jgi:hypothetical protein